MSLSSPFVYITLLLAIASAGCSDSPDAEGGSQTASNTFTASPTGSTTEPTPQAPPPQEILNECYTFPRAGMGTATSDSFTVPEGYGSLNVTAFVTRDCPGGYYNTPGFQFTNPSEGQTQANLFGAGNTVAASQCVTGETAFQLVLLETEALPGEWTLETYGECTCSARLSVIVSA